MLFSDRFNPDKTSSPYRIKANSGKLYIADYADDGNSGVYVYNPVDGSFNQMFQGSRASSGQWTNNGVVIGGSTTAVAFHGEGADRKMFAQCEDYYGSSKWELLRYDLGTADTWNKAPSKTYPNITSLLTKHNVEIFTCEKGVWLCQNAFNNYDNASSPSFIFMDLDGNVKFNSATLTGEEAIDYAFESGIAINQDMTKLAVAGGGGNINFCNVKIYNVTWNGDTPTLTFNEEVNVGHGTNNGGVEQIVFDPAGNLLLFSRQKGLVALTLKNPARNTVTKAPSSQAVSVEGLPTGTSTTTVTIPGVSEAGANRITLYDWTMGREIGSFTPYDQAADQSFLSHSINVRKVTDGQQIETDFFTYAPGEGGMKSIARAIVENNPVQNLKVERFCHNENPDIEVAKGSIKVKLSWDAQTYDRDIFNNYEIRYRTTRSDGSTVVTDWTKVETASIDYSDGNYEENRSASFVYELTYGGADTPNDPSDDYDLVYQFSVIPVYTYDTNDRGEQNTEYTVEVLTPTIPSAAPRSPVDATLSQVTEEEGNNKRYSFNLQLDVVTNENLEVPYDINNAKAAINQYILVAEDEATIKALSEATSLKCTTSGISVVAGTGTSPEFVAYNCDHHFVTGYYVIVSGFTPANVAGTALPSLVWHNVDPSVTYKVNVYGVANRDFNFIETNEITGTMEVPGLTWSTTPVDFYKLAGDYGSLTEFDDMPIGAFRRIDPETNTLDDTPTNPVTLNNANYYGTNGSTLKPLAVTDEVMGTLENGVYNNTHWNIAYNISVFDENDKEFHQVQLSQQRYSAEYAACYSNSKDVICDIIGLKVDYDTKDGEDGRPRKIYNPTPKTYKAKIDVYYNRLDANGNPGDLMIVKTTWANLIVGTTSLPALGVEYSENDPVRGSLYPRSGSHFYYDNNESNGYYPYYYDAAMLFNWNEETTLNRYLGYYGASKEICYGHYENTNHDPDVWVQYLGGSILTDTEVENLSNKSEVSALSDGAIGYNGEATSNWSALAIENNRVPFNIHYVHGSNTPLSSSNQTTISNIKFDVTLTAEYPVINYLGANAEIRVAENPESYNITSGHEMNVMTVPTSFTNMYANNAAITTGVEGILTEACGGVKLYPNPVGNAFTLQAPMTINQVRIFSMDGQLVKEVNNCNNTTVEIIVDELPKGMYLVNTLGVTQMMIKL